MRENRNLKDTVADLLQRGLAQQPGERGVVRKRVQLPLVQCVHEANPDEEMTPERTADVLLEDDPR